jgi:hypothetical protein
MFFHQFRGVLSKPSVEKAVKFVFDQEVGHKANNDSFHLMPSELRIEDLAEGLGGIPGTQY